MDALILSEVLEHCPHPRAVIEECRRVLRPGGVIFLSTPFMFYEHGVPYDFQRPTQFFFRDVFQNDSILQLTPSNSSYSTAVTTVNLAIEATPLRIVPLFPGIVNITTNAIGIILDFVVRLLGPIIMPTWKQAFYSMPQGYSMVVRIQKNGE
jgi:SAM-dependent methyltransferase